jgi:DNA-directed RNA polymerase specialized sigma24 family protein
VCSPDDQLILALLQGGNAEQRRAIDLINARYQAGVSATARRWFPGLSPTDLAECWEEAVGDLVCRAADGQVHGRQPLWALLRWLLRCRCTDAFRRRAGGMSAVTGEPVCPATDGPLAGLLGSDLFELVCEAIRDLPDRQRQVWSVKMQLGFNASSREIAHAIWALDGERLMPEVVRHAVDEGEKRIREYLRRKGYDL